MRSSNMEHPVLVVGGRTTGLMMASELARHGIATRIIDQSPGIDPHARATVLHSRTLEILHELGIAEPLVDIAQPLHGYCVYANGKFIGRSAEEAVDSPFPFAIGLPQAATEKALEDHLNGFGVNVERNTRLSALEQTSDGICATLVNADGGEEKFDTPWLIACDGAHSTVRHLTEQSFPGEADPYPYWLADVVVDGDLKPEDAYIFLSDEGDLFFFILNEGRRFVVANVDQSSDRGKAPTLAQIQELVTKRSSAEFRLSDPRWLTSFHIHYRLVPHYRHGRAFLAGDAAHVHSLIGGQGMNTGIQDAHNLAWKLALVINGVVDPAWLDTYELERRRVAQDVLAVTKSATEQSELFASLSSTERAKLLSHMFVPESEKQHVRRHAEEIDLDYRSSPICVETPHELIGGPHAGTRAEDSAPILVDGKETTFFDALRGPHHRLVFFADSTSENASAELISAVESAVTTHSHWIDSFVVTDRNLKLPLPAEVTLIEDATRSLHSRYGVNRTGIYLIRPDGYVAYRHSRLDSLQDYLERVP